MSVATEERRSTGTFPGWNIHADLLPAEVLTSRHLKVVQRGVVSVFAGFVVLLVLVYLLAVFPQAHSAESAVNEKEAAGDSLMAQKASYSAVTDVTDQINLVQQQGAQLMAGDVVLSGPLMTVLTRVPAQVSLSQVQVSLTPVGAVSAAGTGGSSLDTSGETPIGSITINGVAPVFLSAPQYATAISKLDGVIDVQLQSNAFDSENFTFTIVATVTDVLLSHRFDLTEGGS